MMRTLFLFFGILLAYTLLYAGFSKFGSDMFAAPAAATLS